MRSTAKQINPEDYILSALDPNDRLDSALKIAKKAFSKTNLTLDDVERAVKKVRIKAYEKE
jgi:hypothetical protein